MMLKSPSKRYVIAAIVLLCLPVDSFVSTPQARVLSRRHRDDADRNGQFLLDSNRQAPAQRDLGSQLHARPTFGELRVSAEDVGEKNADARHAFTDNTSLAKGGRTSWLPDWQWPTRTRSGFMNDLNFFQLRSTPPKHAKLPPPTRNESAGHDQAGAKGKDGSRIWRSPTIQINPWSLPPASPPAAGAYSVKAAPKPELSKGKDPVVNSVNATPSLNVTGVGLNKKRTAGPPRNSTSATAPTTATQLPAQRSPKARVTAANASADGSALRVARKTKKLKRVAQRPAVGETTIGSSSSAAKARRPLVVTDSMDLGDVTSLVQEVLERVSETEREIKRLRKEGSLVKTRSSVRERKFVIDKRAKMRGAAVAGGLAGMVVGWSVLPNLWLVGAVTGAIACATLSRTPGVIGSLCATCGIQVALLYKDLRDWWEQTVFLYKTGKLSYTYWKGFEKYDKAWGLTQKYNSAVNKISKEAAELDRQYKIRSKALRASKRAAKFSREVGSSAAKEVKQFAGTATDWGGSQLKQWGILGDDYGGQKDGAVRTLGRRRRKRRQNRPLGLSFDLSGIVRDNSKSLYSAPPAGGTRKPGYRGEPLIPARIRHLVMTPKQIRNERLRKYRVGFMGRRVPRASDKDD